ncbi:MAG TPA: phage holin family protein [Propionibacteriaceae bacterium]|nr:phage holin family protein [Propionibacteriaceae bacterium]
MTDQPVGDIIKGITDDVKLLVRDEIALAKAELIPAAKNGGIGAGLFAGAGYFAICALSVLYFAAAFGLAAAFDWPVWLGFLVVGIALFLVAGICGGIGFMLVKRVKPPERTIAQANQTVAEVKTAAQQALAAAKAPQIEGEVVRERRALR